MRTVALICVLTCLLTGAAWSQATSASATTAPVSPVAYPASLPASAPATASVPSEEDSLAARGLRGSALELMYSTGVDPSRSQRLLALASYADKLQPNNPDAAAVLGYVYENQGNVESASRMAGLRLSANYGDYALGVRYLQLGYSALNRPDERRAFLESILSKEQLPSPLRGQAANMLGDMLLRAGQKAQAIRLYNQAMELDPYQAQAAQSLMGTAEKPTPVDGIKGFAVAFHANPRNVPVALNLAYALSYLGLKKQAMPFLDLVWELQSLSKDKPNAELTSQYFSIMLDAGEYAKVVKTFESLPEDLANDRRLRSLMVETYRSLGQSEKADELAQRVLSEYGSKDPNNLLPQVAGEVASFLIATQTAPRDILPYARRAASTAPDSPMTQRLLGIAEVKSGQPESVSAGMERLEKIRTSDTFAAAVLAEARFAAGQEDSGKETLLAAAAATQSGLAHRRLSALARQKGIELPSAPGADEARQAVERLGQQCLQIGAKPEEFVSVSLKAAKPSFAPGEPIEIEATLTNKSRAEIPLGDWGLFRPTMNIQVSAVPLTKERFTGIPPVIWPAPRCLPGGSSVRQTLRLDTGSLGDFLARRPLEELKLTVTGLVDPMQKGLFREESYIPSICPEPLTVIRASLFAEPESQDPQAWADAYQYALRVIVTDLARGDLQRRMRAGRQVACLIAGVREIERGRVKLAVQLHGAVNKPVLLAMLKKALEDRSPAVRAETLAALSAAKLDEVTLAIIAPMEKDPSPLVRFRLAELLGVSRAPLPKAVMERLAQDGDPMVKMMAGAFQQSQSAK